MHIARAGGRFVMAMPRSRQEDAQLRKRLQTHRRHKHLAAAAEQLAELKRCLSAARARLRGAAQIDLQVAQILGRYSVGCYLQVERVVREMQSFKPSHRGRPGPGTSYRKVTRRRYDIESTLDTDAVAYDHKTDGMYPLLTDDASLAPAQVLAAADRPEVVRALTNLRPRACGFPRRRTGRPRRSAGSPTAASSPRCRSARACRSPAARCAAAAIRRSTSRPAPPR